MAAAPLSRSSVSALSNIVVDQVVYGWKPRHSSSSHTRDVAKFTADDDPPITLDCNVPDNAVAAPEPDQELLDKYAKKDELWVEYDKELMKKQHYQAVGENLISKQIHFQDPGDNLLPRTLIRHDNDKLARVFMRLYFS